MEANPRTAEPQSLLHQDPSATDLKTRTDRTRRETTNQLHREKNNPVRMDEITFLQPSKINSRLSRLNAARGVIQGFPREQPLGLKACKSF